MKGCSYYSPGNKASYPSGRGIRIMVGSHANKSALNGITKTLLLGDRGKPPENQSLRYIDKYALRLGKLPARGENVRHCLRCMAKTVNNDAIFCAVCGSSPLIRGRASDMYYKKIRLNENGKAVMCPHCNNEELTPGDYCMICGHEIVNRCADTRGPDDDRIISKGCHASLPGNARYCYKCGNESTFYQNGWLKDWRSENTKKAIENINVAVDFNDIKSAKG